MGRFDRCWSVIQPTLGTSVAIRTTIEGRIRDQGRAIGISSRPLCALVRVFYNAYMSGSVGLLHARGGLCGCLLLQGEHEAPQRRRPKAWVERERNRRSQIPSSRTRERAGSCLLPVVRVVHPRPQFTVRYRSWASECPMSRAIRCTRRSASQPVW